MVVDKHALIKVKMYREALYVNFLDINIACIVYSRI